MSGANNIKLILAGTILLITTACGGLEEEFQGTGPAPSTWVNKKPSLLMATPNALAVGDTLTVYGKDFVNQARGTVVIRFKGTFYDSKGGTNSVDYQTKGKFLNTGKLTWDLWPNVIFSGTGDKLGRFVGQVVVLNQGNDGSYKYSAPLPIALTIKPSVIPRVARPMNSGCASVVSNTLENQAMAFTVEALGLRDATKDNPLTFYWTFKAEQWKVAFDYGTGMNPDSVFPKTGYFVIEDRITSGRVSTISDGGPKNFLLKVGSDLWGSTRLKELKTGAIPAEGNNMPISANVVVVDPTNSKTIRLTLKLTIHRKAELDYRGETKMAQRFPAQRVSGCMPGQDIGRDVVYSEGSHESRSRAISFNWNVGVGGNIAPIPGNPFALGINFNVGFGVNINSQVSTDQSKSLQLSGHILPGEYGSFYRQTTKWYRVGKIMVHTKCGQAYLAGNAIVTDWTFTPELATGPTCPPPSNLPKAQVFIKDPQ